MPASPQSLSSCDEPGVVVFRTVLIGCNRARRDVFPSTMLRQVVYGRRAYALTMPRTADRPPCVDIFVPAPDMSSLAAVDEQRAWFDRWVASALAGIAQASVDPIRVSRTDPSPHRARPANRSVAGPGERPVGDVRSVPADIQGCFPNPSGIPLPPLTAPRNRVLAADKPSGLAQPIRGPAQAFGRAQLRIPANPPQGPVNPHQGIR
jgi:hypothetical protein